MANAWSSVRPIAELYTETATAVLAASGELPDHTLVTTQGHALTVEDLLSTLAVGALVHHFDLRLGQPSAPALPKCSRARRATRPPCTHPRRGATP